MNVKYSHNINQFLEQTSDSIKVGQSKKNSGLIVDTTDYPGLRDYFNDTLEPSKRKK